MWPTEPIRYEKVYNLFLDVLLLILPLVMLAAAYTLISRTLWQSMDVEKEIVRQASGKVKNFQSLFIFYAINIFLVTLHPLYKK